MLITKIKKVIKHAYYAFFYSKEYGVNNPHPTKRITELDCLAVFKSRHYLKYREALKDLFRRDDDQPNI